MVHIFGLLRPVRTIRLRSPSEDARHDEGLIVQHSFDYTNLVHNVADLLEYTCTSVDLEVNVLVR
jgi:hypothetical protein